MIDGIKYNSNEMIRKTINSLAKLEKVTVKDGIIYFNNLYKDSYKGINLHGLPDYILATEIDISNADSINEVMSNALGCFNLDVKRHYIFKPEGVVYEKEGLKANSSFKAADRQQDYFGGGDFIDETNRKLLQLKRTKTLPSVERMEGMLKGANSNGFEGYDKLIGGYDKNEKIEKVMSLEEAIKLKEEG